MSQGLGLQVSSTRGGGERKFVSGFGLGFHLHMVKDHAWVIICK